MKVKKFENFDINENFLSKIAKSLINNWEKLAIYKISSPYARTTFGVTTDKGITKGNLTIYVEREKKKVKAVADYGITKQEFDIDTIYMEDRNLEGIVDWSFTTDLSKPLKEHLKEKYGQSVLYIG